GFGLVTHIYISHHPSSHTANPREGEWPYGERERHGRERIGRERMCVRERTCERGEEREKSERERGEKERGAREKRGEYLTAKVFDFRKISTELRFKFSNERKKMEVLYLLETKRSLKFNC